MIYSETRFWVCRANTDHLGWGVLTQFGPEVYTDVYVSRDGLSIDWISWGSRSFIEAYWQL